ncbi:anthranilate synthase component II [Sphingomicrobium lutaoense]|uniref:Anthranilate synthase component 2 n=1 Tax=Sphingomicrobium lutaoense TaxID=515949 RepID=A0A839Z2P4_9SPHN|nr:aminodeoxychorismate/anthranilate synthase component II [Sphingomicrobium lutaoense]MBB3763855.1 anthranilate synthase component 2 [Sphingomicrobium lutaoense]
MILVLDNHDSFTFTLVDYLKQLGAGVEVFRNDALTVEQALARGASGILVSPGPGHPADAGISVALAAAAVERSIPYCGICLGHQALGLACGSMVARVSPRHGKISAVRHDGSGMFQGLPSPFAATRYHSLAVPDPVAPLVANAWSDDGLVMAMRHRDAPAHGIQFHPESIASEHGLALLRGFTRLCATESA